MSELTYVKGIGPVRSRLLETVGVTTLLGLVEYLPSRWEDRSRVWPVCELRPDMPNVQVIGRFVNVRMQGEGARARLTAQLVDGTGVLDCVWFKGAQWVHRSIGQGNDEWLLYGKPTAWGARLQMAHPEMERNPDRARAGATLAPVYPLSEPLRKGGVSSRAMNEMCRAALSQLTLAGISETLSADVVREARLLSRAQALWQVHRPDNAQTLAEALRRLKVEELFYVQLALLRRRNVERHELQGVRFEQPGPLLDDFYRHHLPFEPTAAQKRVVHEIWGDLKSGRHMNRLVQGDVGCGKTLVALMAMLLVVGNGKQCCLMAPTEILAEQHLASLAGLLRGMPVRVALLTGAVKGKERRAILEDVADGSIHILIGTHALIEPEVVFRDLALCVIDEQHRFGVEQRAKLWAKNARPPHVAVMTATPIPRTLAMTLYGDLDVSVVDEMPPGRKPVVTQLFYQTSRARLNALLTAQLAAGRQVYVVFPLIEESRALDLRNLREGYEQLCQAFPESRPAMLHGRMKAAEKEAAMRLFASGEARMLVATTVIEVGVNVANATVMVIESAQRYGLSQLHQLRGRVGRGADQSYCLLVAPPELARHQRQRLETLCSTTDGFAIAEADLRLRGPGDLEGTAQSGTPFRLRVANLATDGRLVAFARDLATAVLDKDPLLVNPDNIVLINRLKLLAQDERDWSSIS